MTQEDDPSMNCSHCGEPLLDEALVCPTCGTLAKRQYPREEAATTLPHADEEKDPFAHMPQARSIRLSQRVKIGILAGMAVIAIAVLAIRSTGGGASQTTPEKTVEGFFHAFQEQDAKKMVTYMQISKQAVPEGKDPEDWFVETYTQLFEEGTFLFENFEILRSVEKNETATVDFKMEINQQGQKNESNQSFELKRVKDKWFITIG
jgi:hypothetical protein